MQITQLLTPIPGLQWLPRTRLDNGGKDTYVIPFATTLPMNIVYHGHNRFSYGQYGIHLGQMDVLTFFGPSDKLITAHFIDCRHDSTTFGLRFSQQFTASSDRTLIIPPGVAHTFDGLDSIYTVNNYQLFLPEPEMLLSKNPGWTPESDIINIPLDVNDEDLPRVVQMHLRASPILYQKISEHQQKNLTKLEHMHPETRDFVLADGETVRLMMRKKIQVGEEVNLLQEIEGWNAEIGISGLRFEILGTIKTGEHSSIIPIANGAPCYVVDHGTDKYDFDAYGLHKGQEDNLIFLGNPSQKFEAEFIDFRIDSPTLHRKVRLTIHPQENVKLIIPPGIGHAFWGLENIFTFNRPRLFVDAEGKYMPGIDTYDWPITNLNYPHFAYNSLEAGQDFYERMAAVQRETFAKKDLPSTPISISTVDAEGRPVRAILRKKISEPSPVL